MKIDVVELRVLKMQLLKPFRTSFGVQQDRYPLLVRLEIDGRSQWGEGVAGEGPGYPPETVETAWKTLKGYLLPAMIGRELADVAALETLFAPIRGHNMAKACLEMAFTAALAERARKPLAKFLGGVRDRVETGVSIGIQATTDELLEHIAARLAEGYRRVKVKIEPGWDVQAIGAIRERYPEITARGGGPVGGGGMPETGVGRACNVALATLPTSRLRGDISAGARYGGEDIVAPPFVLGKGGTIAVPTRWGLGIRVKVELVD